MWHIYYRAVKEKETWILTAALFPSWFHKLPFTQTSTDIIVETNGRERNVLGKKRLWNTGETCLRWQKDPLDGTKYLPLDKEQFAGFTKVFKII